MRRSIILSGLLGTISIFTAVFAASSSPAFAQGAAKKPPAKPAQKNETKGQGQLTGVSGQFGTVYSLKNGFNFAILGAHYTLDPFIAYGMLAPTSDEKLLLLDIAIKNATKGDNFFNIESLFTLVDEKGQLIQGGSLTLNSKGGEQPETNLRPGQGLGQPELKDPLQVGFKVPAKARIVKIMVNQGRVGKDEMVLRYYVAGSTKEEAGEAGDPKNIITPLSESVRDKSHPSGALALEEGKAAVGVEVPSNFFTLRLDSLVYTMDKIIASEDLEEGKKYAVATITAKSLSPKELSFFDVRGGDAPLYELTDADGERAKPVHYLKAKRAEDAEYTFKKGDTYTYRVVFVLPNDSTAKKLTFGAGGSRKWAVDVSNVK